MISLKKFAKSMRYAGRGLREVVAREHSFRVHLLAAAIILFFMFWLRIRGVEAALLILVTVLVLVLELVNSIFERFIDIVEPRVGNQVRDLKDIMAGAVLVTAAGALAIGIIIIVPHLSSFHGSL